MNRAAVHTGSRRYPRNRLAFGYMQYRLQAPKQAGGGSLLHRLP
jgi:hypothetical protein